MNEVDSLERFDFGGPAEWALVRGRSRTSPVLLLVQFGPGFPMIHEAADLEARLRLEEHFRVVYWDQRGTGKSFDPTDRTPITLETLVDDVRSMARALCERLSVSELVLVGISLGGTLALLASGDPKLPVRSVVAVGPDVNFFEAERFAYAFAIAEAERSGKTGALRDLRAIGEPPHVDMKSFMTRVRWVSSFRGIHRGKTFGGLARENLLRLWRSPHYSLREMFGAVRGMSVTQARVLPELRGLDILSSPPRTNVSVAVFQGRHDAAAPPALGAELARVLGAELVWFEQSAHLPHEEEPVRFRDELLRFVASARGRSRPIDE